jgi:hypothetical protein
MASCLDALALDWRVLDPFSFARALLAFATRRLVVRPDRPAALDFAFDFDLAIALLLL